MGKEQCFCSGIQTCQLFPSLLALFSPRNWNCFAKFYLNCVFEDYRLQNQLDKWKYLYVNFLIKLIRFIKGRGSLISFDNLNKELNLFFISIKFRVNFAQARSEWQDAVKLN